MPQDRDSGAEGAAYGHRTARGLSSLMGLTLLRRGANEVIWNGSRAVIKACRPATSSLGVTSTMLPRLEFILAALENDIGVVEVWALPQAEFSAAMYDSRSNSAVGGKVKLVRRAIVTRDGRHVENHTRAAIDAAAEAPDPA